MAYPQLTEMAPVINQPPLPPGAAMTLMSAPGGMEGVPQGLEYLTQIDQLIAKQSVELLEAFTGIECANSFKVENIAGQQIYLAAEESGFCARQCCGANRGFLMHVADNFGREVIRAERDFKCCVGCCWFACCNACSHEIKVQAPVGVPIGSIRQRCSVLAPEFEILDERGDPVLILTCPICVCECPCFDVAFDVETLQGVKVGAIHKKWSGIVKEMFTEAENFSITFPMDLDVKMKATMLAALFLINMMYFERNQQKND